MIEFRPATEADAQAIADLHARSWRLGGRNAEVAAMETHGGARVRSCRYVWPRPESLRIV